MNETGNRSHERELITFPISYRCSIEKQENISTETRNGISLDLSAAGICIYAPTQLKEGMYIDVYGEAAWQGARKGSVRWCKMITENLFRVGVQFMN
ncbi:MAG: PilZ domain-containing protein [Nitrospiraceae bacterium]|nr:PilZ domain-containing protein [Nitrospiraceae bacterium]